MSGRRRSIVLILGCTILTSCATPGASVSDAKDAWINIHTDGWNLYYCKSNSTATDAAPVCYLPQLVGPPDTDTAKATTGH